MNGSCLALVHCGNMENMVCTLHFLMMVCLLTKSNWPDFLGVFCLNCFSSLITPKYWFQRSHACVPLKDFCGFTQCKLSNVRPASLYLRDPHWTLTSKVHFICILSTGHHGQTPLVAKSQQSIRSLKYFWMQPHAIFLMTHLYKLIDTGIK